MTKKMSDHLFPTRIVYFTNKGEAVIWNVDQCKEEVKFKFTNEHPDVRDKICTDVNGNTYIGYYDWDNEYGLPPRYKLLRVTIDSHDENFAIIPLPQDVEPDDAPQFELEGNLLKAKTHEYCGIIDLMVDDPKFISTPVMFKKTSRETSGKKFKRQINDKKICKLTKDEYARFMVEISTTSATCKEYCLFRNYISSPTSMDIICVPDDEQSKITSKKQNLDFGQKVMNAVEISPGQLLVALESSLVLLKRNVKVKQQILATFDDCSLLKVFLLPPTKKEYKLGCQIIFELTGLPSDLISLVVQFLLIKIQ